MHTCSSRSTHSSTPTSQSLCYINRELFIQGKVRPSKKNLRRRGSDLKQAAAAAAAARAACSTTTFVHVIGQGSLQGWEGSLPTAALDTARDVGGSKAGSKAAPRDSAAPTLSRRSWSASSYKPSESTESLPLFLLTGQDEW
jgi:hypothetical protein